MHTYCTFVDLQRFYCIIFLSTLIKKNSAAAAVFVCNHAKPLFGTISVPWYYPHVWVEVGGISLRLVVPLFFDIRCCLVSYNLLWEHNFRDSPNIVVGTCKSWIFLSPDLHSNQTNIAFSSIHFDPGDKW